MAKKNIDNTIEELRKVVDEITNKFQQDLSVAKLSDLDSLVQTINVNLERQYELIGKISQSENKQLENKQRIKEEDSEINSILESNLGIYNDFLGLSNDFNDSWDSVLTKSKLVRAENEMIVKLNKQSLVEVEKLFDKEKKIQKNRLETFKKVNDLRKKINKKVKGEKTSNASFLIPQFADPQSILKAQVNIEKLSGGKPYLASHPELNVPIGLFNTKNEPNRQARVNAIRKYGSGGSLSKILPQFFDNSYIQNYTGQQTTTQPTQSTARVIEASTEDLISFIAVKAAAKAAAGEAFDMIIDMIETINKFGDKLEEYAGVADESIRSALQSAGVLQKRNWSEMFSTDGTPLTKAAAFEKNIEELNRELAEQGIFFNIEALTELQKQFTEISKTNVLLGKEDLKTLAYIKTTFDLAANDVADMQSAFMELGMDAGDISEYTNDLTKNSLKFGVNAGKLIKDTGKSIRLASIYRFKGGVKDMQKMQVYAANARFDIENAYGVMDKALSIEGAIDLAAQLQVLGGSFSSLQGMDLFSLALGGDSEAFIKAITEPFRKDIGMYGQYNEETGFQFSTQGIQLLEAFKGIEGFDIGQDLDSMIRKFGKEQAVRDKLLSGVNARDFLALSSEQQENIISQISQGSVEALNLTGLDYANTRIDFQKEFFSESGAFKGINESTAAATMSVKDQGDLNKQLVALESQTKDAFDIINTQLRDLAPLLKVAGETIYNVGIESFKNEFFRQVEVMTDYMGMTTPQAIMMRMFMGAGLFEGDTMSAGLKGIGEQLVTILDGFGQVASVVDTIVKNLGDIAGITTDTKKRAEDIRTKSRSKNNGEVSFKDEVIATGMETGAARNASGVSSVGSARKYGGMLEAAGGLVIGPSHAFGGVGGTGRFNNVEVEGGEAIINKKSTQMFLPILSKLNEIGGGKVFGPKLNLNGELPKIINLKIDGQIEHKDITNYNTSLDSRVIAQLVASEENGKTFSGAY